MEFVTSHSPPLTVARGILHGCIGKIGQGKCCTVQYPSVFANLGDEEIWTFVKEAAYLVSVDDSQQEIQSTTIATVLGSILAGLVFIAILILVIWCLRRRKQPQKFMPVGHSFRRR